jgi:hypothetical protein
MNVSQVIEIAKAWVEEEAGQVPGFCGAYLAGSLSQERKDSPFPAHSDVDIYVVVKDVSQIPVRKTKRSYKGILVDSEFQSVEEYRSPEVVLSSPEYAPNIVAGRILSDPMGLLSELRQIVEQKYANQTWVQARCQWEKRLVEEYLAKIEPESTCGDMFEHLIWVVLGLGGLVAVAHLRPPTVRKCLVLTQELLQDQGRLDLHQAILRAWGCARFERSDVERCLEECITAFNRAVQVIRTPFYGIHQDAYPYLVEGSREMIDAGHHREAMFWIMLMHSLSNRAIQRDAPEGEKHSSRAGLDQVLNRLGLGTVGERHSRLQLLQGVKEEVFNLADQVVQRYSE